MTDESYERIVIQDREGNSTLKLERPLFGDLTMTHEGGKTVIHKTAWLSGTTTYVPAPDASIKAEK
ncbi:MAG: hypothetical protein KME42_06855 [Tildeniella nuda ZEHNDER 1965/U140]|jgi:hypothetical protein|nr:hypothetical protein [Tildeniella nuda ZEHNDER 1965/U140]